ncbi:hypothetical protein PVAP13_6KG417501 [Panicum virgatum]|uniref:Uncharacterized protein n=1 Tax=Panicum virgatum TaxID=38727 RepID=A0A8T0RKE8_PANVG|nr:hypothetical protein PVAP13_6KG417501 [Panicum virgatum]
MKITVSSAYCRCDRPFSIKCGTKPSNSPCLQAKLSMAEKASSTRLKSRGERGSLCLRPLKLLKNCPLCPFKLTATLPPLTTFSIQLTHLSEKPFLISTSSRKLQLTLS